MVKNNSLLKKLELFEKLSFYGKRGSFLNKLAQNENTNNVGNMAAITSFPNDFPPATKVPNKSNLPLIPKDVQKKLNDVCIAAGLIGAARPLNIDGVIGQNTRNALEKYKIWKYLDNEKPDAAVITALKLEIASDKLKEETAKANAQGKSQTDLNTSPNDLTPQQDQAIITETQGVRSNKTI